MQETDNKKYRQYGYNILINHFEPFLRKFIIKHILQNKCEVMSNEHLIPKGVFNALERWNNDIDYNNITIEEFIEELTFLHLKDILLFSDNFSKVKPLLGRIDREIFREKMDSLNLLRRKIAHAKSTFTYYDLIQLVENVRILCSGKEGKEIRTFLEKKQYEIVEYDIPNDFLEEDYCLNNLPPENYDRDGGFVGREREIKTVVNYLKSDEDRIITISGAGGVGKTALALKIAYLFLYSQDNPYEAIMWYSAKTTKLTDYGIVPLTPNIKEISQLVEDISSLIGLEELVEQKQAKKTLTQSIEQIYALFKTNKFLLIIDNLETIVDEDIINFIKNIPRPSQVLITSRKGLGELERRYPLKDMDENDAIHLFKLLAKERNLTELEEISEEKIKNLVKRVKCYPLLIKWSIGQYSLGKELEESFKEIFSGESEIAKFSFNDVFKLLTEQSKHVLYAMIIAGEKPISKSILMHLTNLDEDNIEDAIRELIVTSLIYPVNKEKEDRVVTEYNMLELTRGFIESKLDENKQIRELLNTRYYDLSQQIKDLEKSKSNFAQSLISLGIKTIDEQIAFNYVKTAKNYEYKGDNKNAENNYKEALKVAPNLSYIYTEFSKFKFNIKHFKKSLEYAETATRVNPNSFHAWFNLGIIQRRLHKYTDSIESLKKAKELNSKYLPIYTELGRSYSSNGEYEKAENEFQKALSEDKYPNYRHQIITYQFMAENYRRWAQKFNDRRDFPGQLDKLHKAKKCIETASLNSTGDWKIWKCYRKILIDLGIAYCKKREFGKGIEFFKKSVSPIKVYGKELKASSEELTAAHFYIAVFITEQKGINDSEAKRHLSLASKYCPPNSKWEDKINRFMQRNSEKLLGIIESYNKIRRFGIIKTENETYLFFGLKHRGNQVDPSNYVGREVSFRLKKNERDKSGRNPFLAIDVSLI